MVTQEEIRGKLSLDTTALGRAKRDISDFSEHGHSGFVHVGSSARGFHRLLEKITEASPLLGTVLTAALSPVNAALLAAGTILTVVNRKLEEWNAKMDKAQARNATAIFGADAMRAAAAEVSNMRAEHDKFMHAQEDAAKTYLDALEQEQQKLKDNLAIEQDRLKLNKQLGEEIIKREVSSGRMSVAAGSALLAGFEQRLTAAQRTSQQAALGKERAKLEDDQTLAQSAKTGYSGHLKELEDEREATAKRLANAKALLEKEKIDHQAAVDEEAEARKRTEDYGGNSFEATASWLLHKAGKKTIYDTELEQKEENTGIKQRGLEAAAKKVADLQKQQADLNSAYDTTKEKVTKWTGALEDVKTKIGKVKEEQDKLAKTSVAPGAAPMALSSPNEFSISELGQYNTRFGYIARLIAYRQRLSKAYSAAGLDDTARAINQTIDPNGGANSLYNLLPAGMTSEQNAAQRQKDLIDNILKSLGVTGADGVPVKVTSIPNGP